MGLFESEDPQRVHAKTVYCSRRQMLTGPIGTVADPEGVQAIA